MDTVWRVENNVGKGPYRDGPTQVFLYERHGSNSSLHPSPLTDGIEYFPGLEKQSVVSPLKIKLYLGSPLMS